MNERAVYDDDHLIHPFWPLMLTDLQLRLLWFLLAGFVMGFATSYLWEVLYARGRRWRDEVERATEEARYEQYPAPASFAPAAFVPARAAPSYRADARAQRDDEQDNERPGYGSARPAGPPNSAGSSASTAESPQDFGSVNVYQSPDFYLDSEGEGQPLDWSTLAHESPPPATRSETQRAAHDDFTHLEGLRKPHAEALYRADVYSFEQLAGMMPYEVTALLPAEDEVSEEEARSWLVQALNMAQARRARVAERAPLNPSSNA